MRVARAELDVVVFQQPPGQAAAVPFGAGIRAGTQNDPQAFLLRDAAKFRVVGLAGPDIFAGMRLVQIPKKIRADGVQAHCLGHLQTVSYTHLKSNRNVDILRDFVKEQDIPYFYDVIDDPNGHWHFDASKGMLNRQYGSRYAGVCHTALPQKGHTRPGEILFGTDSHTCMRCV